MSEPVSNAEIEDVLSSIRRLVSQESSDVPQGAGNTHGAPAPAQPESRLVLTPAFRVAEAVAENDSAEPELEDVADEQAPDAGGTESGDDATNFQFSHHDSANSGALVMLLTDIVEPEDDADRADVEQPDDGGAGDGDHAGYGIPAAIADVEDGAAPDFEALADQPIANWEDLESPENAPMLEPETAHLSGDQIVHLETAINAQQEEWEPDGSEPDRETPDAIPMFHSSFAKPEGEAAEIEDGHDGMDDADNIAADPSYGEGSADEHDAPSQDEAARHAEIDQMYDEAMEFVEKSEADNEGEPDHAGEDFAQEAPAHTPQEAAMADGDAVHDEDSLIDEESLRLLISGIVREELQGELGERITRNVRKLVRREISRTLASRDFN